MSIQSEIDRIKANIAGAYSAVSEMGGAVPAEQTSESLAGAVRSIPAGISEETAVPPGGIIMWSGETVPAGWALCDGQNGTPDLRGRFVLGASGGYSVGDTGGEEEVTLKVRQMPKHAHSAITESRVSAGGMNTYFNTEALIQTNMEKEPMPNPDSPNFSGYIVPTGNNEPHPNMPPYYVLAYIMKI